MNEAAYVVRVTERRIQSAIDRGRLLVRLHREGRKTIRKLPMRAVFSFALEQDVAEVATLNARGRGDLTRYVDDAPLEAITEPLGRGFKERLVEYLTCPFQVGHLSWRFNQDRVRFVLDGLETVLASRREIVSDPRIRGGEPVFSDTRLPARVVADLKAQGVEDEVLIEDFPSLTPARIAAAVLYAQLNPRRGRPAQAPWHDQRRVLLPANEGPDRQRPSRKGHRR